MLCARTHHQPVPCVCFLHPGYTPASHPADRFESMQGLHLTADLHGCRCASHWLTDADALGARCLQAVANAGLQAVAHLFYRFPATQLGAGGITATVLLAESHLCVHTWPEQAAVTLDVYVCNFGADHADQAQALMAELTGLFAPAQASQNRLQRGAMASGFHRISKEGKSDQVAEVTELRHAG